ncbi:MAG: TIGR02147 family protein [Chitinivibrionales bacterium]|nr:TIGR02147 family protein [Chitinivibrionales bacterium]
MKSIYEYLDYRQYLQDFYEEQKQKRPLYFSYRYLSRRIRIDSSYLAKVMAQKKHLSVMAGTKICSYLKLSDTEAHYFTLLMYYARAKNEKDRSYFFERLSASRQDRVEDFNLEKQQLLSQWYPIVLWELLHYKKVTDDPDELARRIIPPLSSQEVSEALALLKELRFIETQRDGTLRALQKTLLVNEGVNSTIIHNHKKQVTALALQALDRFSDKEQAASYVMASLSEKSLAIIRRRLKALMKDIFKLADCEQENRRVYHFVLHGFPVTIHENE